MEDNTNDILFHQDSIQCRQLFPIETWELISKRLKRDPNSIENLTYSSPFFRDLFSKQKSNLLLKKTLAITVAYLWNSEGKQDTFPLQEFLKCRQLNSHRNHLIDNILQENVKLSQDVQICPKIQSMVRYNFSCLYTPTKLVNFLNHFQVSHQVRSPFICPELSVHTQTLGSRISTDEQQFLDNMSNLLLIYGCHVRHFNIDIEGVAFLRFSNILQYWLGKVKNNLKSLKIECDEMVRDAAHIANNGIPKFKQLDYLETSKLPASLFNKLVHQNCDIISSLNIRTWEVNYNLLHSLNSAISESRTFANLKTLELSISWRDVLDNFTSPLVHFPMLSQLTISSSSASETNFVFSNIRWSEIFQMIQDKFAKSLEKVLVELPKASKKVARVQSYQDSLMFRLCLPKLREISLVLWNNTSLDFLLPMKDTLEIPKLMFLVGEEDEVKMTMNSIVQLRGFEDKIWASNITYLFTNLQTIGICKRGGKTQLYSRDWIERMRSRSN